MRASSGVWRGLWRLDLMTKLNSNIWTAVTHERRNQMNPLTLTPNARPSRSAVPARPATAWSPAAVRSRAVVSHLHSGRFVVARFDAPDDLLRSVWWHHNRVSTDECMTTSLLFDFWPSPSLAALVTWRAAPTWFEPKPTATDPHGAMSYMS